jgi:hypothetical protein
MTTHSSNCAPQHSNSAPQHGNNSAPQNDHCGDAHLAAAVSADANIGHQGVDVTATAVALTTDLHADVHIGLDLGHDGYHCS